MKRHHLNSIDLVEAAGSIAVVNDYHLGDLLFTLRLVAQVKEMNPSAQITLLLGARNYSLAKYLAHMGVECKQIYKKYKPSYVMLAQSAMRHRKKYDLILCALEPRKHRNLWFGMVGSPVLAYANTCWHSRFISHQVLFSHQAKTMQHDSLFQRNLIGHSSNNDSDVFIPRLSLVTKFNFNKHELAIMAEVACTILVNITDSKDSRSVQLQQYIDILNGLKDSNILVLIAYTPGMAPLAHELSSRVVHRSMVIDAGSFDDFLALINSSDVCLTGDGGTMHLAAALGKKMMCLFAATSPTEWAPLTKKYQIEYEPTGMPALNCSNVITKLTELMAN